MARSKRERTLLVAAGIAVVGVLGYVYLLEPLREWKRAGADLIPTREAVLERRRQLVATKPAVAAELESVNKQLQSLSPKWLQGPTPPLAASELQTLVKGLAEQAGAEVRSERILPLIDRGGLQEVPIEITVASGLREAVRLLYDLEHTTKLLTVHDLKVRVVAVGQPRDLLSTFTVSGYLLPGATAPTAGDSPSGPPKS